nr:hypothetical protein [Tanacetum cinerariifolium]
MGFGSLIGMAIHELPGMLGSYVIDNLDTETNVLCLTDNSILVNSQSVHDILGIPMGRCSLESLESRSPDDPFIKEWFSQFGDKNEVWLNDITDIIVSTNDVDTTTGIDNDDTTGIDKESYSPDCQIESDSPAFDDNNQKNDKVDDSWPAAGFCFVIEGDEVKLSEVEDVEKEKQQIGNEDDRVVDDSNTTVPNYVTEGNGVKFIKNDNVLVDDVPNEIIKCSFEVQKKYSLNECDAVIQDENKEIVQDSVERSAEDAVDSQHTIEDIFKQDEQIQSTKDDAKLDVYNGLDLCSPYEYLPVDVKKPVSDVEKIVADTLFAMIGSKLDLIFESQSGLGLYHLEMETLTPTLIMYAYVIDVWAELLNILEIYKDESLPLRYFFKITIYIPGNVGAEDAVDSQHTIEDIFKQDEQIQSTKGCSISVLDDAKLDVYNDPDLCSPYEYLPVDVKKPVSDVEKIVADTLFSMIGSKLDLILKVKVALD